MINVTCFQDARRCGVNWKAASVVLKYVLIVLDRIDRIAREAIASSTSKLSGWKMTLVSCLAFGL